MEFKLYSLVRISILIIYCVEAFDESNIQDEIEFINSAQSSWKAEFKSHFGINRKAWKKKLGLMFNSEKLDELTKWSRRWFTSKPASASISAYSRIPKNFDSRKAWLMCKHLISSIRDQSNCGSCWATASASALSDRFCVASKGRYEQPLSAEDLLRCCDKCKPQGGNGCEGGDVVEAVKFMYYNGIVTGGEYGSKQGCMPYSFKPCSPSNNEKKNREAECVYNGKVEKTAKCSESCTNPNYNTSYKSDKYFISGIDVYTCNETNAIKMDLMKNGTCIATMKVYEDFVQYKSGIYTYEFSNGKYLGGHAIRLIGWGRQKNFGYWLAANSWGTSWGENGTFKISLNTNCRFGKYVLCLTPY